MREQGIPHEYRVRNGAHTWDYWHSALPEALRFIGCAVRQIQYPDEPDRLYTGLPVPESRIKHETSPDNSLVYNVVLPEVYSDTAARFPLIIALHDRTTGYEETESQDLYSLLAYQMDQNKCPQSLVVEIPVTATDLSAAALGQIIDQVRVKYRVSNDLRKSILLGMAEAAHRPGKYPWNPKYFEWLPPFRCKPAGKCRCVQPWEWLTTCIVVIREITIKDTIPCMLLSGKMKPTMNSGLVRVFRITDHF
jgi:hypothetical protein